MLNIIDITEFEQIQDIIFEQNYDLNIKRNRSSFLYRGLPNIDFKLLTSLERNCKEQSRKLESCILRNFTKYAMIEDSAIHDSVWRQLIVGQHHGLPTRLLDWTYSPLIGLHFATSGEAISNMETNDSVVWKIDICELNRLLPPLYRKKLDDENAYLFTVDMLDEIVEELSQYDRELQGESFVLLEPPSIDQRIVNQYSYFSIIPKGMSDIEDFLKEKTNNTTKYIVHKEIKWRIRDMLDQININERVVFPGLDGIGAWLTRHYYVK